MTLNSTRRLRLRPSLVVLSAMGCVSPSEMVFSACNGIPCRLQGESLRNTHGLTLDGLGEVEIFVPRERYDEARTLLDRVESGDLTLDGD